MPLKIYKRGEIWHYRGQVAQRRLRGSCQTANKEIAERFAAEVEAREWKSNFDGPQAVLTFPQAVTLYKKAGKGLDRLSRVYIDKIVDHWKNTLVKDMTAGAIRQSAIDLYPGCSGATWNRQVITPTQGIINHCADLELCPPIRVKRFKFEAEIKKPVTLQWVNTFCGHARPVMKVIVLTMFSTACRFSEAHRLEWSDIDFKARTILIRDTKTKKQRNAHMPAPLLVALANLSKEERPFPWSESSLRRFWDQDVAATAEQVEGFERLTCHSCRHGFATKMLRDGIDAKTAAALGGWNDIALFMRVYAHAMEKPDLTEKLFDTPVTQGEAGKTRKPRKSKGWQK